MPIHRLPVSILQGVLHAFRDLLARAEGSRKAAIEVVRAGTLT